MQQMESLRLSWKVDGASTTGEEDAMQASTSGSDEVSNDSERSFVVHKGKKLDTLAGIAIKYSVPIADIRRFNGLLSDTAMHAHGTLLIPTQLQPVSEEVQLMFAQVATGLGRNPLLHSEPSMNSTSLRTGLPPSTGAGLAADGDEFPWWCQCGGCSDEGDMAQSCPSTQLKQLQGTTLPASSPSTHSFGPVWSQSEVMRRRYHDTSDLPYDDTLCASQRSWSNAVERQAMRSSSGGGSSAGGSAASPAANAATAAGAMFASIGKAFRESAMVQKIKQAAAAGSNGTSGSRPSPGIQLVDVADGVFASLRQGLLPKGNPPQFRVTASPRSFSTSFHKLGPKCD